MSGCGKAKTRGLCSVPTAAVPVQAPGHLPGVCVLPQSQEEKTSGGLVGGPGPGLLLCPVQGQGCPALTRSVPGPFQPRRPLSLTLPLCRVTLLRGLGRLDFLLLTQNSSSVMTFNAGSRDTGGTQAHCLWVWNSLLLLRGQLVGWDQQVLGQVPPDTRPCGRRPAEVSSRVRPWACGGLLSFPWAAEWSSKWLCLLSYVRKNDKAKRFMQIPAPGSWVPRTLPWRSHGVAALGQGGGHPGPSSFALCGGLPLPGPHAPPGLGSGRVAPLSALPPAACVKPWGGGTREKVGCRLADVLRCTCACVHVHVCVCSRVPFAPSLERE